MKFSYSSLIAASGAAAFALLVSPAHAAKYPGALEIEGPDNVYPGQVVTYTVEATNIADQTLSAAVTTFHFDTSTMEFLPGQSTPGCSVTNPGYADCILGDMAPEESATVQFVFKISENATCKSDIEVDVDFKAADGLLVDWVMWELNVECKKKHKCYSHKLKLKSWIFKKHHKTHKEFDKLWQWKHHSFKKVWNKKHKGSSWGHNSSHHNNGWGHSSNNYGWNWGW